MKAILRFLCTLTLLTIPFASAAEPTKSTTKKRSDSSTEKARAKESASATPAPTKKKKAPATDDEPAPVPARKKPEAEAEAAPEPTAVTKPKRAPAATLEPAALAEFSAQPPRIQQLITAALALTKLNLTYTFGSADPAKGGMDCSGTIYCLLRAQGFASVPRDSSSQYAWARKAGPFFSVLSSQADSFEFSDLQPGDLLFWTGTYTTGRDIPISHVMLYLGREKRTGNRVMFGASDGRSYAGIQRWGVSVFDFKMPKTDPTNPGKRVDFVGYARIPGLRDGAAEKTAAASEPLPTKLPAAPPAMPKPTKRTRKGE